jgi:hypothetical protein
MPELVAERWMPGRHNRHPGAALHRKQRRWRRLRRTWTRRLSAWVAEMKR